MQNAPAYDYIIVGGGPTGLALAHALSSSDASKVLLLEKKPFLGGCHGVTRVYDGMMTEHGPRIYIDNFFMFSQLLNETGIHFHESFVKYNFSTMTMMMEALNVLSAREIAILFWSFITLNESHKKTTLLEYLSFHHFSKPAIDLLDRIGRLTDGGSADVYTLFSFIQIINQNFLYGIYQPRVPNDVGLFNKWEHYLQKKGVVIMKNANIDRFICENSKINGLEVRDSNELPMFYECNKVVLACPPQEIQHILDQHEILGQPFGSSFEIFQKKTQYLPYISIIFHWNKKMSIPKIWGYPRTSWGIGHIVLSDYMDFNDDRSKTVISSIITMPDSPSDKLNASANQISDKNDVMNEAFRQLQTVYPNLPPPDYQFLTQNEYDDHHKKWIPFNHAFMTTVHGYIPNQSTSFENLYNCGVQNGNSSYSFTSIESSVVNAVHLAKQLQPELNEINTFKVREATTLRETIGIISTITVLAIILNVQLKKKKK